mmetsp:Transcript_8151/g.16244  ORF Transcript_8151/g.16244 Transcript_8151/m.16244 type:complete len:752 (+) Transcript_8151:615-2870(+)|eukprot:CAMPEP_0171528598 /NCGR_PEP_ID=MMETSP0959-20130129/11787_1 /TAXON_ID=87120 /ORGANISM="Aurantiochytrium limacinum, Strain ATCCMYA-1381" /LENGTH=751 /DNA_ID=CAMNT_0012070649 /DNA_START=832 /DNA_END=3087 /DNA_ORIENTATION=-
MPESPSAAAKAAQRGDPMEKDAPNPPPPAAAAAADSDAMEVTKNDSSTTAASPAEQPAKSSDKPSEPASEPTKDDKTSTATTTDTPAEEKDKETLSKVSDKASPTPAVKPETASEAVKSSSQESTSATSAPKAASPTASSSAAAPAKVSTAAGNNASQSDDTKESNGKPTSTAEANKNVTAPTPNRRPVSARSTTSSSANEPMTLDQSTFGGDDLHSNGNDGPKSISANDFGPSSAGSPPLGHYSGAPLLSSGGFVNSPAGNSLAGSDGLASPAGGAFGLTGFMTHGMGFAGTPGNSNSASINALSDALNVSNTLYGSLILQQLQSGFNPQAMADLQLEAARKIEAAGGGEAPRPSTKSKPRKRTASGANKNEAHNSPAAAATGDDDDDDDGEGGNNSIVTSSARRRSRQKSSMYRGVSRCAKDGRWQARIRVGREVKYLGRYKTEIEAARRYDVAAKAYHRARAVLNFKDTDPDSYAEAAGDLGIGNDEDGDGDNNSGGRPQTVLDPPALNTGDGAPQGRGRRGAGARGRGAQQGEPSVFGQGSEDMPESLTTADLYKVQQQQKKKSRRATAVPRPRSQVNPKVRRNSLPPQSESFGAASPETYAQLMEQYKNFQMPFTSQSPTLKTSSIESNPVFQTLHAAGFLNPSHFTMGLNTSPSHLQEAGAFGSNSASPANNTSNARSPTLGVASSSTSSSSSSASDRPTQQESKDNKQAEKGKSPKTMMPSRKSSDMNNAAHGLMSLVDKQQES